MLARAALTGGGDVGLRDPYGPIGASGEEAHVRYEWPQPFVLGFRVAVAVGEALPLDECARCGAKATSLRQLWKVDTWTQVGECDSCCRTRRRMRWRVLVVYPFGIALGVLAGVVASWVHPYAFIAALLTLGVLGFAAWIAVGRYHSGVCIRSMLPEGRCAVESTSRAFVERIASRDGRPVSHARLADQSQLFGLGLAVAGVAGLVGGIGSEMTYPRLVVFHSGAEPQLVWVDGRRAEVVAPRTLVTLRLRAGEHVLASSDRTASSPSSRTATANVQSFHSVLYNPGPDTCFWRAVHVYGRKEPNSKDADDGAVSEPLPLSEVYVLKPKVDHWFEAPPSSVEASEGEHPKLVVIEREETCTTLLRSGCERSVLDDLLLCEREAADMSVVRTCQERAAERCKTTSGGR